MLSSGPRSRSSHSKATRRESPSIVNQLRPSCSCIQIEIGNFRQLDSHFRGDISTGCPVAASAMSRRRNSWATRNSRHFAASSGIGIPEKTASLSSNTRRRTILNDFVIRVVASITNQSRGGDHGRESTADRDKVGPGVESRRQRPLT
ncbi:MAG: hypothetical protein WCR51_04760 [Planctomycetia bacterium]